ncbi:hypothetical protein HG530_010517 [Fusarium avenaceum]|nr:hypothetical protein HG530_010517 [Fusarium avenaceum]
MFAWTAFSVASDGNPDVMTPSPSARLALHNSGKESILDGRISSIVLGVLSREEAVLKISHEPRATARTGSPDGVVTKVNGFHVTVACVFAVGLGIAVVEAAATVVVSSIENSVHTLWLISRSRPTDLVVAVSSSGRDENTVCLLPVQGDWCTIGTGKVVIAICLRAIETTRRSLCQMVIPTGLVIDDSDKTGGAAAERVLSRGICHAAL